MALLLLLETSATNCSAALSLDGECLYSGLDTAGSTHSVQLGLFVDEALKVVEARGLTLDGVAVSAGPGSYTGLRIGVSMAKGICYAKHLPLLALPTLDLLADTALRTLTLPSEVRIRPLVDARRMEVYTALYDAKGKELEPARAVVVEADTFAAECSEGPVCFVGDGSAKCAERLVLPNAIFETGIRPLATEMAPLAERFFREKRTVDVAYFEPFYLKDFVTTTSKKSLIPTVSR
jgi:tRNA threonylcarbamoyladenosine biosynthesis protein TsaB